MQQRESGKQSFIQMIEMNVDIFFCILIYLHMVVVRYGECVRSVGSLLYFYLLSLSL